MPPGRYLKGLEAQCAEHGFDLTVETQQGFVYLTIWQPQFGALFRCTAFGSAEQAARYLLTEATLQRLRERDGSTN